MLEKFKGEIARALPKHINPDRMARIALTAFRMNPKLSMASAGVSTSNLAESIASRNCARRKKKPSSRPA
ncbi:hypothetical protein, partial [Streptococcus pneumoniae]|uniref:hypothetical protein n=1 Tax=Streptococcus pneumoniae TaxID=1313 RepID=UPI001CB76D75